MSGPMMSTTDPVLGSTVLETSTGAFCGRRAAPWTPHLCSVGESWRPSVLTVRAQGNSSEAGQDQAKKQQLRGCLLSLPCALLPSAISSLRIQCLLHRHHHHPHSPGPCLRDAHRYFGTRSLDYYYVSVLLPYFIAKETASGPRSQDGR